ncbi:MAG: YggS family pyridoxal phosphate-dependent enzyme [Clostridiales Family XIII bacterium]|jgi:pyridoxal phosphate enzyme (YggS family)|nr:YggS family pyridoxal phosphate-dependent enzyme [Clostridiales Family XIII bacterium]
MRSISENIMQVRRKVDEAAARCGRNGEDVTIIAVTKTRTPEAILEAVKAGLLDLGENKVQEIQDKYEVVSDAATQMKTFVNWHMIGHLQRNKVKYLIGKVYLIHSVDSFRLCAEIDKHAKANGLIQDILVQVNAAEEDSKFGLTVDETPKLVEEILIGLENVRIRGLMTIGPLTEEPEETRQFFRMVRSMYDGMNRDFSHERLDMQILSMGMTNDYEVAIEEGSNMIRVGTGLFGPRV